MDDFIFRDASHDYNQRVILERDRMLPKKMRTAIIRQQKGNYCRSNTVLYHGTKRRAPLHPCYQSLRCSTSLLCIMVAKTGTLGGGGGLRRD